METYDDIRDVTVAPTDPWWQKYLVKKFYKAHSYIANGMVFLVAVFPDLANYALLNFDATVALALPTLSVEHKVQLFSVLNMAMFVFKMYKQKNGPVVIAEKELAVQIADAKGAAG